MATEQELITLIQRVLGDRLNRIQSGVCLSGGRQGQTVTVQIGQSFHQGECWEAIEPGSRVLLAKTDQGRSLVIPQTVQAQTSTAALTRLQVNRPRSRDRSGSVKLIYWDSSGQWLGGFSSTPVDLLPLLPIETFPYYDFLSQTWIMQSSRPSVYYLENLGDRPEQWRAGAFVGFGQGYRIVEPAGIVASFTDPDFGQDFANDSANPDIGVNTLGILLYPVSSDWWVLGYPQGESTDADSCPITFFEDYEVKDLQETHGYYASRLIYDHPYSGASYSWGWQRTADSEVVFVQREPGRYRTLSQEESVVEHNKIILPNGYTKPIRMEVNIGDDNGVGRSGYFDFWFPLATDLQAGTAILGHVTITYPGPDPTIDTSVFTDELYFYNNGTEVLIDKSVFEEAVFRHDPRAYEIPSRTNCLFVDTFTTSFRKNQLFYLPPKADGELLEEAIKIGTENRLTWPLITYTISSDGSVRRNVREIKFYGIPQDSVQAGSASVIYISFNP